MGNIGSRLDDNSSVYLKDQTRFSISSVTISSGRKSVVLFVSPNAFPATRLNARREAGDDRPVSYIQDPESPNPSFILNIDQDDKLEIHFTFVTRQSPAPSNTLSPGSNSVPADVTITGLTFAYAPNPKELDTLITREFHTDPNLHKNNNVQLIGDYRTNGSPSVQYEWSWIYRPPKASEDKGGGWRNSCSFLEYDSRAHRLNTLASFSFWVNSASKTLSTPLVSPGFDQLTVPPPRSRMVSSQSYQSTLSDSEGPSDTPAPPSPSTVGTSARVSAPQAPPLLDVACPRPGDDLSAVEDGPLFRATMKSLEQKTGDMRIQLKKVIKKAEAAQQAQVDCNVAMRGFLVAIQEAASSNSSSAFKPALDYYFTKIAQRILQYETENGKHLQKQIIEPFSKLYQLDIKQVEAKKKDFEDESREYYAYVSRYLGQRQESLKEKKRAESDSKYQNKKRNFELKRFDYSTFMQDLHGGRKEQELLSQLTRYADGQAKSFLATAKEVEKLVPHLDALSREVAETDKEYKIQRTEREEKRRNLEKNAPVYMDAETIVPKSGIHTSAPVQNGGLSGYVSDTELNRADSTASTVSYPLSASALSPNASVLQRSTSVAFSTSPGAVSLGRDLEDSQRPVGESQSNVSHKKEGLLWASNAKAGPHINPKEAWHKYWVVLDQGRMAEYSNWKEKPSSHLEIDLLKAIVRDPRSTDRRFCFEVVSPSLKEPRVYQATSDDDRDSWMTSINNAIQSAMESYRTRDTPQRATSGRSPAGREFGSALTGRSSSQSGPHGIYSGTHPDSPGMNRHNTVSARPSYVRTNSNSFESHPSKLLEQIRAADEANTFCADCGSTSHVEWISLNLGTILCIKCGGIHRSLGTHISKVRSLTLDFRSFTTDIVELLLLIGNRLSNMIWEAKLDYTVVQTPEQTIIPPKPDHLSPPDVRHKFISAKYKDRLFVDPVANLPFGGPDELLLTSIKKNDIPGALHAIALRANINVHDKSRGTHSVFLALAAADPAAPGTSPAVSPNPKAPLGSAHSHTSNTTRPGTPTKAFPLAELLVQNGAEIPPALPSIPLSAAARLYFEQRGTSKWETASSGPNFDGATDAERNSDKVGPLPSRGLSERDKDRWESGGGGSGTNKLHKRGSAGARFAGKVARELERGFTGSSN